MPRKNAFESESIQDRLADQGGRRFWRSLDELAQTDEFRRYVEREFPENASELSDKTSRRRFLQLMGASLALAGINGCAKQPEEKIIPHVRQAEYRVPGKPWYYASAMAMGGFAKGVLVESHMGRPTKIEGNKLHPASLGATDVFGQAAVLTLYDPDRSQTVMSGRQVGTWNSFLTALSPRLATLQANDKAGLRLLTETITSPTLKSQIEGLLKKYPNAKWHQYEPINRDNERAGLRLAFGQEKNPIYDFTKADVVLSLDADFLTTGPASVRYARDFMSRRFERDADGHAEMNRLYVVESSPTPTGGKADHRWALSPTEIESFAFSVAKRLGLDVPMSELSFPELPDGAIDALVDDLKSERRESKPGHAVVIAGPEQPPAVHALAHAMNALLGSVGEDKAVRYTDPVEAQPVDQRESLDDLIADLNAGNVEMLVILDANPVYNAPPSSGFLTALAKAKFRVHMGLYRDETARLCDWHLPETHFLETWSDARAYDGTTTIIQPLIKPLYNQKSRHELLAALDGHAEAKGYDVVKSYWQQQKSDSENFERWWEQCLHDGIVPETAAGTVEVSLRSDFGSELSAPASSQTGELELCLSPDPTIWDGRFANNGWLQELPKPITKLTWDNAALISPPLAKKNSLANGDVVELSDGGRKLRLPVWLTPGQSDHTVTVHLGYGRKRTGKIGKGTGFDAFQLQPIADVFHATGVSMKPTGDSYSLVTTQNHHSMEGRHLVRSGNLEEFNANPKHPKFITEGHHGPDEPISFYEDWEYDGYKWGMAINLGGCTGCNACVAACQSENNIPVVGKEEVGLGREMHWIRVDHYYEGDPEGEPSDLAMHFQPVNCMHCEKAPCEPVCPVAATTHSDEGLNEMTYNRCVGTRYCANNCPYKVRRFNFFEYTKPIEEHETLKMVQNPDVTVRARGVMEKCTYCVQRISQARITAEKEQRSIRDGEVVTACQAACPTQAITFGDLNDPNSEVTKAKNQSLDYVLLEEINTRPRTSFTASVFNPNPSVG